MDYRLMPRRRPRGRRWVALVSIKGGSPFNLVDSFLFKGSPVKTRGRARKKHWIFAGGGKKVGAFRARPVSPPARGIWDPRPFPSQWSPRLGRPGTVADPPLVRRPGRARPHRRGA
ncbi:hypothetical protein ROR02_12500 [Pararhodospirillum oryzae]|uniref:Uncharacterized protein n=1 Tax=Pararhodospirillum oryzae TaxID=478448 RepID=A0A512H6N0_9PROT|nr:hypothetical protein ROR02_12500 [Pararhodospirillum oryzae]